MSDTEEMRRQALAWRRHLAQDTVWTPANGRTLPIADMDPAWRHNAANWLLKRAAGLCLYYSLGEVVELDEPIGTDMRGDPVRLNVPSAAEDELFREQNGRIAAPEVWLKSTPLYRALVDGLPVGVEELARHWSGCDLRTGSGEACSCWKRHQDECPVFSAADITRSCRCNDFSPEWTLS